MTIERDDSFGPGFDFRPYERPCPRECEGRVTIHYTSVHEGTHGDHLDRACSLTIVTKCKECGHLDNAQPPITREQYDWFVDRYDGNIYYPWLDGDMREYEDGERERIEERLDALGYI